MIHIIMNRPTLHNAFNEYVIAELRHIFQSITDKVNSSPSGTYRGVVLSGAGASFSAGADLNWMAKMVNYTEQENMTDATLLYEMIESIYLCPIPVIARVNGSAMGGGVGLISACDMAVAVQDAKFGLTVSFAVII